MSKYHDLTGMVFGRWTAIKLVPRSRSERKTFWTCKCSCGTIRNVSAGSLVSHHTKSCGCLQREGGSRWIHNRTHGESKTVLYKRWAGMRDRCSNPKTRQYSMYGARGILVCKRWSKWENFRNDMKKSFDDHSNKYGVRNTTLERLNNNLGYSPENCVWTTFEKQNSNRRGVINFIATRISDGYTECAKSVAVFARKHNLNLSSIHWRLKGKGRTNVHKGWRFECIA